MQSAEDRGGTGMEETFNTMKLNPIVGTGNEAHDILMYVYKAIYQKKAISSH